MGHDLGSDPMPSLDLYWPCFQIQLNSIRKKTKLYLIRRLQPQKNVNLSVFFISSLIFFFFSFLHYQCVAGWLYVAVSHL